MEVDGNREWESSPNATTTIIRRRVELHGCKEENKRMIKELVEKKQMTSVMLQSLSNLQRQINSRHHLIEVEGSRRNSHKKNVKLNPRKKGFKISQPLKQQKNPSQVYIDPSRVMRENTKKRLKC